MTQPSRTQDLTGAIAQIDITLSTLALTRKSPAFKAMLQKFNVQSLAALDDDALIQFRDYLVAFQESRPPEILSLIRCATSLAFRIDQSPRPWHSGPLREWRDRNPRLTESNLDSLVDSLKAIAKEDPETPANTDSALPRSLQGECHVLKLATEETAKEITKKSKDYGEAIARISSHVKRESSKTETRRWQAELEQTLQTPTSQSPKLS